MLINIDPLLTPDWLYVLAAMGHGDELAVVDANFPAESVARGTAYGRPLHLSGATMPEALSAVLSLLPLDEHVEAPVRAHGRRQARTSPTSSARFKQSLTAAPAATGASSR